MTSQSESPSSLSIPASPEDGFNLPSPTLTPHPSSPTSVQDTLIPDLSLSDVDIGTSTHLLSVSGDSGVPAMLCAHPNQLWAPDGLGMQRKSSLPLSLFVPPGPQPAQPPPMGFSTSCFRLVPPQHPAPVFSWAANYQHPSPVMPQLPQFYRPPDQYQLMTEVGRPFVPHANYVGVQGRGVEALTPGVLRGMHHFRMQKQSTLQYRGAPQVPMFSATVPVQQHGCYNMPPSMHESQLPNFGPTGPQFHPHAMSQLRPNPPNFHPQASAQVTPQLFPQAAFPTPTSQLYPRLRPQAHTAQLHPQPQLHPMSQFRPLTPMHPQTPTSQLHPQTPTSQLRPAVTTSQFRPQTPATRLRPITPASQLNSPLHPRGSPQVMPQLQNTTSLRPQTAPPQITTSQPQHSSPPIPQSSQQSFIDLTQDTYSAQQRTITRVSNYPVPSSQIPPPSPIQVSSVSKNQQFCSIPPATGGSSCGHTIVRPLPIHSTTHGNPGFSPAAVRATVPSVPLSPFTPISSTLKPTSLSPSPLSKAEATVTSACTVAATGSDSAASATTTTMSGNQSKQTGRAKKAAKRKPAKPMPKTGGRKPRRTKQPTKPAEDNDSAPAVAVNDSAGGNVEEIEISEQVVEVVASDLAEMQIYVDFVKRFKSHHVKLGYKLEDIIQQVAIRYGKKITLQYIEDFEDLLLQKESYIPLLEILDMWVKDTAKASGSSDQDVVMLPANSICPHRMWKQKRKQKTCVDTHVTLRLEDEFAKKKSPTPAELLKLASSLGVEKDYVRNWFYNRRRKEKCMGKRPAGKEDSVGVKDIPEIIPDIIGMEDDIKIPSLCYDITVEVPSIHPRDMMLPVCAEYTLQN